MKKRLFAGLLAAMMVVSMMGTTAFAVEPKMINTERNTEECIEELTVTVDSIEVTGEGIKLEFISLEEMEQLISDSEAGISTQNWFPDVVKVTFTRLKKADGTEYCRVVLLNVGFPFDRVDVDGVVWLYDMSGIERGRRFIDEPKLVYNVARPVEIHPIGGHYATGSFELRLSDGDDGTVYRGTFI